MDIALQILPNGYLKAVDDDARLFLQRKGVGNGITAKVSDFRNIKFHRKFFALLNYAFDMWEAPEIEYKNLTVKKSFDSFRKDLIISAGYYDTSVDLDGNLKLSAKSISFARMEETEFSKLYEAVFDVILQKVLVTHSREELEMNVNILMGFS